MTYISILFPLKGLDINKFDNGNILECILYYLIPSTFLYARYLDHLHFIHEKDKFQRH